MSGVPLLIIHLIATLSDFNGEVSDTRRLDILPLINCYFLYLITECFMICKTM